ncbi:MAG: PQQ-binding-like beta-propeller repeat protein [Acidimicrobiales bacterium]|nr:PQQ-binding-like beta-propeller repeat protein [Acidimicrobiales bacterium]
MVTLVATRVGGRSGSPAASERSGASHSLAGPRQGLANAVPVPHGPPATEAGLLPWQLSAPLSREVVAPNPSGGLEVVGGLEPNGTSGSGVFSISVPGGAASALRGLSLGLHDAAGARLGDRLLVFGGGDPVPSDLTQSLSLSTPSSPPTSLGHLPQPRADASAVTVGSTVYVVGGFTGSAPAASVLATSDGVSFRPVATLPVPVRYAAVAALSGKIYVFGGLAVTGQDAGQPVNVVQVIDPRSGKVTLGPSLPTALAGAAAGVVGGTLYVAGGDTTANGPPSSAIWALDPSSGRLLRAGNLPAAVANAGVAVVGSRLWLVGGEAAGGTPVADVQMVEPNPAFGIAGAPGAGSPYYGDKLLIADRGNNQLLLLNDSGQIVWRYPSPGASPPSGGFYYPDDAFFARHGTVIIVNQEDNETMVQLTYPAGRVIWSYGHPLQAGSTPGYLSNPDDAYLLKNGDVVVADIKNCRILEVSPGGAVVKQLGTTGRCVHDPPNSLASPNGDTPLADGNLLVSEINGSFVDELTPSGHVVWSAHLPIGYPSDPQQIGPDRYVVADYESPGAILEFDQTGRVLYRYQPTAGPGVLNQPSLAELLPSGVLMANDDHNHRMVAIDPATSALVWQYGVTGTPGASPGMLNTPDGFDVLGPGGTTPTHPSTG